MMFTGQKNRLCFVLLCSLGIFISIVNAQALQKDIVFVQEILLAQRAHFADGQWDRFFGYAAFYRDWLARDPETKKGQFDQTLLALEILALSKHCQWDAADDVYKFAISYTERATYQLELIEQAKQHLLLHKNNRELRKIQNDGAAPSPLFNSKTYWKLRQSQLRVVDHPKNMRATVKNRCHEITPTVSQVMAKTHTYTQALIEWSAGNKAVAIDAFKGAFAAEATKSKKIEIATLIALSGVRSPEIKTHLYAEYVLENAENLDQKTQAQLLRVAADGYFKSANLDKSHLYFSKILTDISDTPAREYATYQIGWIYLNQQRAKEAQMIWSDWLSQHPAGQFREEMIRDVGRSWVEARYPQLEIRSISEQEMSYFHKGVVLAIRREKSPNWSDLRARVKQLPGYAAAIQSYLENGPFAGKRVCHSLGFFEDARASGIFIPFEKGRLIDCSKQALTLDQNTRTRLLTLLDRHSLTGADRLLQAELFYLSGDKKRACEMGVGRACFDFISQLIQSDADSSFTDAAMFARTYLPLTQETKFEIWRLWSALAWGRSHSPLTSTEVDLIRDLLAHFSEAKPRDMTLSEQKLSLSALLGANDWSRVIRDWRIYGQHIKNDARLKSAFVFELAQNGSQYEPLVAAQLSSPWLSAVFRSFKEREYSILPHDLRDHPASQDLKRLAAARAMQRDLTQAQVRWGNRLESQIQSKMRHLDRFRKIVTSQPWSNPEILNLVIDLFNQARDSVSHSLQTLEIPPQEPSIEASREQLSQLAKIISKMSVQGGARS